MLKILHTNDMHGTLTPEIEAKLADLRAQHDVYFDTGDCIKTGNLGIPLRPEPVWPRLAALGCTASVIGNRETHVLTSAFWAKLAGRAHPVLCGNLRAKNGTEVLPGSLEFEANGLRIGVISAMVPMVTEKMKTQAASAFLWDQPLPSLGLQAIKMRPKVDLLIALTHVGLRVDRQIAEADLGIDIILGGHSHDVLESPEVIGKTTICQGGSHSRFAGSYVWDGATLTGGLIPLRPEKPGKV